MHGHMATTTCVGMQAQERLSYGELSDVPSVLNTKNFGTTSGLVVWFNTDGWWGQCVCACATPLPGTAFVLDWDVPRKAMAS